MYLIRRTCSDALHEITDAWRLHLHFLTLPQNTLHLTAFLMIFLLGISCDKRRLLRCENLNRACPNPLDQKEAQKTVQCLRRKQWTSNSLVICFVQATTKFFDVTLLTSATMTY